MVKEIRRALDGRGWKCVRNVVAVVAFCVIALNILSGLSWMLRDEEDMSAYARYTENPVGDVVFLGTSHAFCSIIPQLLYDEYGIASQLLAAPTQRASASYALARKAIQLNKPRVIVMDPFFLLTPYTYNVLANAGMSQQVRESISESRLLVSQVRDVMAARLLRETDALKYEMMWRLRDKNSPKELMSSAISGHSDFWRLSRARLTYGDRWMRCLGYCYESIVYSPDMLSDVTISYGKNFSRGGGICYLTTNSFRRLSRRMKTFIGLTS